MKIHVTHEQASDFEAFMDHHGLAIVFNWSGSDTVSAYVRGTESFTCGAWGSGWKLIDTAGQRSPADCVKILAALMSGSIMRSQEHVGDWRYFEAPKLAVSAETLAKVEREVGR